MMILIGLPVSAINLKIALRQLSVSNFGTTSICTSITVRHVNRKRNLFYFLRPIPTDKGRNQSARKFAKAAELSKHFLGRSTIIALIVCALLFLQVTHFWGLIAKRSVCLEPIFSVEQCFALKSS